MNRRAAVYQAFGVCGAFLIAFSGLTHEVVGDILFPWGPDFFGLFLWHTIGIAAMAVGSLLMAGMLRIIRFPVVPVALLMSVGGIGALALMAITHQQFHYFALWLVISGIAISVCYRRLVSLDTEAS